jgi:hypothetical protein
MKAHHKSPIDPFICAARQPELVELPAAKFIAVDGAGAPEQAEFQAAIAALYGVAYAMRFAHKQAGGSDYKVPPLEALWWAGGPKHEFDFQRTPRTEWRWKAMIRVPDDVTTLDVDAARRAVIARRGDGAVSRVALERFTEGRAVQMLHVGPYATEPASLAKMHALMQASRLAARGYHHEIYLGDPRRAKPQRLRTILRQAVA